VAIVPQLLAALDAIVRQLAAVGLDVVAGGDLVLAGLAIGAARA